MTMFCKFRYYRVGDSRTLKLIEIICGEFCIGWFRVSIRRIVFWSVTPCSL